MEFFKGDILLGIKEFHKKGSLPIIGVNAFFITLIPKGNNHLSMSNHCSISLVRFMYKILSNVVLKRLKVVLFNVINQIQSSFVPGRNLSDSILVGNKRR